MCEWGNTTPLEVTIPASHSSTGKDKRKVVDIDSCFYEFVELLNDNGFPTVAHCCGHGKQPAVIAFHDKGVIKEMLIMSSEDARRVGKLFEPIN